MSNNKVYGLKGFDEQQLKAMLRAVMSEYARRFCEKYGYQEGWCVADDYVGVYCTDDIDMSISASDVVFCVDNDVDEGVFKSWWQYVLESDYSGSINLRSWAMGVRPGMFKDGYGKD